MKDKRMPTLPDTGRHYLDRTRGAKLASPGLERYVRGRSRTPQLLVAAAVLVAALIASMLWLSRGG
jgi:hypothetical protein